MYVTYNFLPLSSIGLNEKDAKGFLAESKTKDTRVVAYDRRNGIYCIRPKTPKESFPGEDYLTLYLNYIKYLNELYTEWQSFGYFDLGLVPFLYGPSFMADKLNDSIGEMLPTFNFNVYSMPASSLLLPSYDGATKDIWIKREDMASLIGNGCIPEDASLITFLEGVIEDAKARYGRR